MAPGEDPANIIDGKRKHHQTERSKAAEAQAVDGSDDASTAASTTRPKKKSKIASGAKKLVKKVVNKLAPQKSSASKSSAPSAPPSLAPVATADSRHAASNIGNISSLASVKSVELPDLIEVQDSDDEEDGGSVMENGTVEEDDDAKLRRALATWNAPVYAFYSPVPSIEYHDGRKCYVWACLAKNCHHEVNRFLDTADASSTKNLRNHVKKCWGEDVLKAADEVKHLCDARKIVQTHQESAQNGSITQAFSHVKGKGKITYSHRQHTKPEARAEFVRWISESLHPFAIAKDRGFNCLMKTGRPECYIPHPSTISRDVKTVFAKSHYGLKTHTKKYNGDLNFAMDAWTSPNHRPYIAVTVHFEYKGEAVSLLLDFIEVAKSHTGANLAEAFENILNEFGISDKPPKKKKEDTTNDIERDLIELAEGLEQEDLDVHLEEAEAAAGHVEKDDVDGLIDEVALLSAEDKEKWLAETRSVQMALIRKLSYKIIHSSTILLPEWRKIIDELKLAQKMLPRDVSTRWNSTFDMLDAAIAYKSAIKEITGDENNKLTEYELSRMKWTVLENLHDVLKVLKDATLYFSRSTPNLATVIPAMDHINQVFATTSIRNTQLSAPMRASLLVAKKTLNRYYSMTDKSDLYRIAMNACRVLREEFDRKYKHLMDDVVVMEDEKDTNAQSLQSDNIFDNLNSLKAPKRADVRDDLDRYLSTDTELTDNPLMWWKEKQSMYPCLSRMALDYLSIPGARRRLMLNKRLAEGVSSFHISEINSWRKLEIFTIAYPVTSASASTGTRGQKSIPIIRGNIRAMDDPTRAAGTRIRGRYLHLPGYIQIPAGICAGTCIILIQFLLNRLHCVNKEEEEEERLTYDYGDTDGTRRNGMGSCWGRLKGFEEGF
ncbi:uncharacterized protein ARMOST_10592 [Armillaria ostoyae]|uniref:HAT C-terminal dimerisation domain-containing protein n=1 Tax=Armillaria ostoyae TaxID=47428 RepID=A0A284RER7_ARMOS|nr:uncharacterized protein ARMOST_10592 [Armillaria ostoyae]